MPSKSSIFLRFLDPLCTVLHLLQKTNQGNITAVKDDVKKVFYRIWDVIWTLIFWFLSIAIFLRILNWCSQVQLNCQRNSSSQLPSKSSIFLRFLDPLCTVLHLLQKTNQGNITAVKDDVKKVFYRIWDVIWTLIFWFLSIAIFLRILNWCSQVQLNCQRKKTLNKIYFNIFLSIIYLILVHSEVHGEANTFTS